ncbi:hypothetical protein PanWU01x14_027400 [Parasponia andersonii]|uniref:Uncharacterized protein n=1 Tax=Parasponia andersonii TaxID=3476 RepID=A0A2P5DWD6_PARAD|nr:hypothetical protein PanWU01x14_027400 [Parasponia andersonii]
MSHPSSQSNIDEIENQINAAAICGYADGTCLGHREEGFVKDHEQFEAAPLFFIVFMDLTFSWFALVKKKKGLKANQLVVNLIGLSGYAVVAGEARAASAGLKNSKA